MDVAGNCQEIAFSVYIESATEDWAKDSMNMITLEKLLSGNIHLGRLVLLTKSFLSIQLKNIEAKTDITVF